MKLVRCSHALGLVLLLVAMLLAFGVPQGGAQTREESPHGDLGMDCSSCHNTVDWKVPSKPAGFDHATTGYPLAGKHASAACRGCHTELTFAHVAVACADCHTDIHRGQAGPRCEGCHSPSSWANHGPLFELHAAKGFPLVGVHAAADCEDCHEEDEREGFTGVPVACVGCHAGDYESAENPPHRSVGYGTECETCHRADATWKGAAQEHPTSFPLTQGHAGLACSTCHKPEGPSVGGACIECHQQDYAGAMEPPHQRENLPLACEQCHGTSTWGDGAYDHAVTGFALTGKHLAAPCLSCHEGDQWSGLPQDCNGCHSADYDATNSPPHAASGIQRDCETCHDTGTWGDGTFDHAATGFALTGAHLTTECTACHTNGQWQGLPGDCYECHVTNYNGSGNPPHLLLAFPHECLQCHNTSTWGDGSFDHAATGFALTGAHVASECTACHTNGQWQGLPDDCYECHVTNYNGSGNPPHLVLAFPHECLQCHNTSTWGDGTFDHAATGFALTGAHVATECTACHTNGQWQGLPGDCYSCHTADYSGTDDPPHVSLDFPHDCTQCHNTSTWGDGTFEHAATGFALTGAHVTTECTACHTNGQWQGLPGDCYSCHTADYSGTDDPPHASLNFPHDCTQCHNTSTWGDGTFDHAATGFALTGAHVATDCTACHTNGQWQGLPDDCYPCHTADYSGTDDPPHASLNFPHDCTQCHNTSTWGDGTFEHAATGFALTGAHVTTECTACHTNGQWQGLPGDCYSCHTADYSGTDDPPHASLNFPHDCTQCHSTSAWGDGTFDHAATGFALTGAHVATECAACHTNGQWQGLPGDCYECHITNYNGSANPPHMLLAFPHECLQCHNTSTWGDGTFDHAATGFALTGAHVATECTACHTNGQWQGLPGDCYSCHTADYSGTDDPPHAQLDFPHDCTQCHNTSTWGDGTFNHAATGFALTGAHVATECTACHTNGQWQGLPGDCYSCHTADYSGTDDPPHAQLDFPHDCTQCHSTSTWGDGTFNHSATGFALTGAHIATECTACHANGQWQGLPGDCYSCHTADYSGTNDPPHAQLDFPHDCTQCHNTSTWGDGTFNHAATGFALTGAHVATECTACHTNGQWQGLPADCYSCHTADYSGTDDPPHASLNFPHDCTQCHNTSTWGDGTFNHAATGFALTGAHTSTACTACHANGQWQGLPNDCYSCHTADYSGTDDPPHAALNFPHDCTQCHNTSTWGDGTFNHAATGFALTGAHVTAECTACHANGQWQGLPDDCYECHIADYNGSEDPPHLILAFPHECLQCHNTSTWGDGTFDHAATGFALTGAHTTTACTACHTNGQWQGLPADCYECHIADYNGSEDPPHLILAFPHECLQCHNTSAWGDGSFDHAATGFALTGAHTTTACTACHANGQWQGLPTDCYSCHAADYNSTTDPSHAAAHFGTACQNCHSTNTWDESSWSHEPYFPIRTGRHRDVWTSCATCHENPADYLDFECIHCHEHNRTDTDDHHREVNNYEYVSARCYACHPRGTE